MGKSIAEILAINRQIGRGYDHLGEPRPLTDKEFFEVSLELELNQHNENYRKLHENLAIWIRDTLGISSALEIGSGPGYLLYCLNRLGIQSVGVDGNAYSKTFFDQLHPEFSDRFLIDRLFEKKYAQTDALISIEAFEHIPEEGLHRILSKVRTKIRPRFVVFSSTPYFDPNPGWDIQWGHINVKQPEEWHELFRKYGYALTPMRPPVTEWASLYVDAGGPRIGAG